MQEELKELLHTIIDGIADGSIVSNTQDYHKMINDVKEKK